MKFADWLNQTSRKNNSLLCVGLDTDIRQIPRKFLKSNDPVFLFNREIVKATCNFVCAYKPNMAFYETQGPAGLKTLIKTIDLIHAAGLPVILDGKRGDIGNSSAAYARSIFEVFKADAATVSPYMGHDSVQPFLEYREKGVFVLCLTSNAGARDFQKKLYKSVARKVADWNHHGNCGLVVGATRPEELREVRKLAPTLPILIPGVGAQGGDLGSAVKYGGNNIIINASRSIIYADDPGAEAEKLRDEINQYR